MILKTPFHKSLIGQWLWGMGAALGAPPLSVFGVFWVAWFYHVRMIQQEPSWKTCFKKGWAFHTGFFMTSLHWIVTALSVDWSAWWWLTPPTLLILPAFLGLFGGGGTLLAYHLIQRCPHTLAPWIMAASYTLADWLRGHIFTGFPWPLYGHVVTSETFWRTLTSGVGIYGLGFLVLWIGSLAVYTLCAPSKKDKISTSTLGVITGLGLLTYVLYAQTIPECPLPSALQHRPVRIVQPYIDQASKEAHEHAPEHLQRLYDLSSTESADPLQLIIWPETACPYTLSSHLQYWPWPQSWVHTPLITGVVEAQNTPHNTQYFNSLWGFDEKGKHTLTYRKKHLVPFSENVPWPDFIPWRPMVVPTSYTVGHGPITLTTSEGLRFSPLICYDAIFTGDVVSRTDPLPHVFINITNDGWFSSWGPVQHLHIVSLRAAEEGIPLIRATNTGISALIDARGHIMQTLPFNQRGVMDVHIPPSLAHTPFRRYGDGMLIVIMMVSLTMSWGAIMIGKVRQQQKPRPKACRD